MSAMKGDVASGRMCWDFSGDVQNVFNSDLENLKFDCINCYIMIPFKY
jgi:predicted aldo/keto reductase-like oxidoreductase